MNVTLSEFDPLDKHNSMATILRIKMKQPLKDQIIGGTARAHSTLVPQSEQGHLDWAEVTRFN